MVESAERFSPPRWSSFRAWLERRNAPPDYKRGDTRFSPRPIAPLNPTTPYMPPTLASEVARGTFIESRPVFTDTPVPSKISKPNDSAVSELRQEALHKAADGFAYFDELELFSSTTKRVLVC